MWTRNYYNILTSLAYDSNSNSSSSQPTDYGSPIMIRCLDGSWYNCKASYFAPFGSNMSYGRGPANIFSIGNTGLMMINGTSYSPSSPSGSGGGIGVGISFGSGDNPESYEDFRLQTYVTGLTLVNHNGIVTKQTTYDSDTHVLSGKRKFTINNGNSGQVTLREFGICVCNDLSLTNSSYTSMYYPILVYREVFDEPIVLESSESIVLEIERSGEIINYTPYPQV